MARRQVRQGFSIEELQAGAFSEDDDEESEEEEAEINEIDRVGKQDDGMSETEDGNDHDTFFLDQTIDVKNERWVREHFEKDFEGEKICLCCPSCFTPVTYLAKQVGKDWVADKVVHCVITPTSSGQNDAMTCGECGTRVGHRRKSDKKFILSGVLPSTTAEQL